MKEVFSQSASEIQEIAWVVDNVKSELQELKKEFFFEKDDKEVRYNMNAIKDYLSFLKDKSWNELAKEHQFPATMAVQIALRKLGYQSGKVDGILWNMTKENIGKFQSESGLTPDGIPGPLTINKILEKLNQKNSDSNEWAIHFESNKNSSWSDNLKPTFLQKKAWPATKIPFKSAEGITQDQKQLLSESGKLTKKPEQWKGLSTGLFPNPIINPAKQFKIPMTRVDSSEGKSKELQEVSIKMDKSIQSSPNIPWIIKHWERYIPVTKGLLSREMISGYRSLQKAQENLKKLQREQFNNELAQGTDKITFLTDEFAQELVKKAESKWQEDLFLGGIKKLTDKQAEILSKYSGNLRLDGISELNNQQIIALSKHRWELYLEGLHNLKEEQKKLLSQHKGTVILSDQ